MLGLKDEEPTKNVHDDVDRLAEEVINIYVSDNVVEVLSPLLVTSVLHQMRFVSAREQNPFFLQHCHDCVKSCC